MVGSFREKARKKKDDLIKRHREASDRKDEGPQRGSIFIADKIPEGVTFWKPDFGMNLIDVIPFEAGPNNPRDQEGRLAYVVDIYVHMSVGTKNVPVVCPMENFERDCPICEYMNSKRLPKKEWNMLRPRRRTVYLVWVHDDERKLEKKGVHIWEVAHWFFENYMDELKHPKTGGVIPWSHYDKGKSVSFSVKKTGKFETADGTEADSIQYIGHQLVDRDDAIPDDILDQSFCLDDCIEMHPDYDEIKKLFHGRDVKESEDEQTKDDVPVEDETPKEREEPETQQEDDENPCPAGYKFGADIDTKDECNGCKKWDACLEESERILNEATTTKKDKPSGRRGLLRKSR